MGKKENKKEKDIKEEDKKEKIIKEKAKKDKKNKIIKEKTKKDKKNKKENNRKDFGRIAVRVIAAILALIMVLAVAATLFYYL